jgi:hypothetical protein
MSKAKKTKQQLGRISARAEGLGAGLVPGSADAVDANHDRFLVYGTEKGIRIEIRVTGETLWMTQRQMSDLFGVGVPAINKHLSNIYDDGELMQDATISKMEMVASDGKLRSTQIYNLDAIISVGYRVSSKQATQFRIWATERLKEILLKGWSIDSERLKHPDERNHLRELKEIIRDIRASEANVYKEVRSICSLCQDYDATAESCKHFLARMQNMLLYMPNDGCRNCLLQSGCGFANDGPHKLAKSIHSKIRCVCCKQLPCRRGDIGKEPTHRHAPRLF